MGNYKGFISVICVIIMLVCGFLGIKSIFYSSTDNVVPDVVGMKSQEAVTAMKDAGFMPFIDKVTASVPTDTVVSQSVGAGTKLAKGTTVYLRVSFGGTSMEIPDVTGMNLDDAVKKLQDMGLTVNNVKKLPNKEYPTEVVFAQSPSSPQTVDTSTNITLLVSSNGDNSSLVQIPDVVGKSQSEATNMIESSGLKLGEVKLKSNQSVADGCVISQNPHSGLSVSPGTAVSIDISSTEALDDLSIEKETTEPKKAPIKRVIIDNKEELDREASNENLEKNYQKTPKQLTQSMERELQPKTTKDSKAANDAKKALASENRVMPQKQAQKTDTEASHVPAEKLPDTSEKEKNLVSQATTPISQSKVKTIQPVETKQTTQQVAHTGKIAKIRYQTPPIAGNNMSLKIVIHDDNGTRVLRDGVARSLEYISLNARYNGTAKITIYLGGEEVWHDKYN